MLLRKFISKAHTHNSSFHIIISIPPDQQPYKLSHYLFMWVDGIAILFFLHGYFAVVVQFVCAVRSEIKGDNLLGSLYYMFKNIRDIFFRVDGIIKKNGNPCSKSMGMALIC